LFALAFVLFFAMAPSSDASSLMQATAEPTAEATAEVPEEAAEDLIGIGVPVANEGWELTVESLTLARDVQSVFMETVSPSDPSQAFFLVAVSLKNLAYTEDFTLPEFDSEAGDQLLSGVPFYVADPEVEAGAFALADAVLVDAEDNEYPVVGVAVGESEEFLVDENLAVFFAGLPEESGQFTFAFAAPGMLTANPAQLTFRLGDLVVPLVEVAAAEGAALEVPELTETFDSGDGLTLNYPAGWVTTADPGMMGMTLIGPSIETLSKQTMNPGEMAVAIMGPAVMKMAPAGTPLETLIPYVAGMMGTKVDGVEFQELEVGGNTAMLVSVAQRGVAVSILALDFGDENKIILVAFGHESQAADVEAALVAMGETAVFAAP